MPDYRPTEPYVIQSGNRKGKTLEMLMFQDYSLLEWWIKNLDNKSPVAKNRFHQHLEWLMKQGENRQAEMACPQCQRKTVNYFSSLGNDQYGYSISPAFTCCGSQLCRTMLLSQAGGAIPTLYPVRFSSIIHYRKKFDQKMVMSLLRTAYGLPHRLTAKAAFDFFSKQ